MNDTPSLPHVPGFRFAGTACGLKQSGAPDLALLVADRPSNAAAVFTTNVVRAAPVEVAQSRVARGRVRAVLVNSGNANACTGPAGRRATERTSAAVADALGIRHEEVFPASTGVIGVPLPAPKVLAAVPALVAGLDPAGAGDFARAILTTDRGPKTASRSVRLRGRTATVLGIAKGAGMIHPDLATTLAFLVTDAPVRRPFLRRALLRGVAGSFNASTVDGDTSTNDCVLLLASGAAGGDPLDGRGPASARFHAAVGEVLDELVLQIVSDGEGAEHAVTVRVLGAPSRAAAVRVARTVATSTLVKTAIHGKDPNWGRLLAAAGRAGVPFDAERASVAMGPVAVYRRGKVVAGRAEARAASVMQAERYTITLDLAAGQAEARYLTSDLGHRYVEINADYRT